MRCGIDEDVSEVGGKVRGDKLSKVIKEDTTISCLSEYLKAIENLQRLYPTKETLSNPTVPYFLYRGISDKNYELLPSVLRIQKDSWDPEDLDNPQKMIKNETYLTWGSEKAILQSFIQEASGYISLPPDELLKWAEYAQHYGAPTRFLDWSGNPLVALYFACHSQKRCDGNVWLLHVPNYKRFTFRKLSGEAEERINIRDIVTGLINGENKYSIFEYPILYAPYYVDARMSAQSSWFMVWGTNNSPLEAMIGKRKHQMEYVAEIPKEITIGENEMRRFWHRFSICADSKQRILRELDTAGINEKTLFPGLDGIGRYVEKKYHLDYAELARFV